MSEFPVTGRVVQVSVSPGGVPKHAVSEAFVGLLGLEGDRHRSLTTHGGPHRAVCLFAMEALDRVAAEGHPIEPGSVGENLTTEGVELSLLAVGTRLAIGTDVVLEISGATNPCDNIADSFHDRRSGRISILTHPADSRMYARTLAEGVVRPGDPIRVLAPSPDSQARVHELLDRLDGVGAAADLAVWDAARRAGHDVAIVDERELVMAAAPGLPGPTFNRAHGYRTLPHLVDRMLDHFRAHGVVGWVGAEEPPWPGAQADASAELFVGEETDLAGADVPEVRGLEVRPVGREEAATWGQRLVEWSPIDGRQGAAWVDLAPFLVDRPGTYLYTASVDGEPAAVSAMFARRRVAILRSTAVAPAFRGRGIHGALIAHRARLATEAGAMQIHAAATPGSTSARNLARMGLRSIWHRSRYRFDPGGSPS